MQGMNNRGANFVERREETYLKKDIFGEEHLDEMKENDKHEIIVKICDCIGGNVDDLKKAEKIFEEIKFEVTKYVLHHEYSREKASGIRTRLLTWLESKVNKDAADDLNEFFGKYIK